MNTRSLVEKNFFNGSYVRIKSTDFFFFFFFGERGTEVSLQVEVPNFNLKYVKNFSLRGPSPGASCGRPENATPLGNSVGPSGALRDILWLNS